MKLHWIFAAALAIVTGAAAAENLRIIDKDTEFVVTKANGQQVTITRTMTPCAKNKGWLQVMEPEPGVTVVGEIEILNALNDRDALVIDMRSQEEYLARTIPGAIGIPYTEVATRMGELGCEKSGEAWQCGQAKKVFAFCNGPVCPQSPMAIHAMVRDGFPADHIYYYRGGMLDWDALGFTTAPGDF